ncbi:MAG TPA: DUF6662 family protein [Fibrobacteria bacterium]|nr:DUF6662 family protein [Fibrobacteria bacterium]
MHPSLRPLLALALAVPALANERHFTYTYETAVLAPGAKEVEVWSTSRIGHDDFYSRLDHRLEFETGITERLQTAFYLNWKNTSTEANGEVASEFAWGGISNEWKWKLMDPVADAFGFALYGEVGYNTDELELEAKTLFDKRLGKVLLAANLVGEAEFEQEPKELEIEEYVFEVDLGAAYQVSPRFSVGLELRNHNEFAKEAGTEEFEYEHSALFLGPNLSYATESWWVSFSVLPQLPALMKNEGGSAFVLDEHEYVNSRLLFAFHL